MINENESVSVIVLLADQFKCLWLWCSQIKSLKTNFQYEGVPASQSTDEFYSEDEDDSEPESVNKYRQQVNYRYLAKYTLEYSF